MANLDASYLSANFPTPIFLNPASSTWRHQEPLIAESSDLTRQRVRERFIRAAQALPKGNLPQWLSQLLTVKLVPALKRIGFDPMLSWSLFHMAAPAWKCMGPIGPKTIYFHPVLMRELAEIRRGWVNAASRNSEKRLCLASMNAGERFQVVVESMHPRNLFHMLDDIPTSWIILPRVYHHLEKKHARWLPGYLAYLEKEEELEFAIILARIITEFVGNFALKFRRRGYTRDHSDDVLFYGYAAMFWNTLQRPPRGFEKFRIFENFLRWTRLFCKRCLSPSADKRVTLAVMEKAAGRMFESATIGIP